MKPGQMKNLLIFMFLIVFAASCDDDGDDNYGEYITNGSTSKTIAKGGESVNGIYFSMDSISRQVIIKTCEKKISDICIKVVEDLTKKGRVLEYKNELGDQAGYVLNKDILDSLAYYNYTSADIGTNADKDDIVLYGIAPYREKGIWESITVTQANFEKDHPKLFEKSLDIFFKTDKPLMKDIMVENQGGNFVEYNAKVRFADGNEQYVHFNIANKSQKLVLEINGNQVK